MLNPLTAHRAPLTADRRAPSAGFTWPPKGGR